MGRIAVAGCALLLCFVAAPAQAARITSHVSEGTGQVTFVLPLPGERSDMTVERAGDGLLIRDVNPVRAEGDCRPVDANTAVCPAGEVNLWLGPADDRVVARDVAVEVEGGEGDDRLTGGTGGDSLDGEGGSDALDGGDGNDFLSGGPGGDAVRGGLGDDSLDDRGVADAFGVPSDDLLDGGEGVDFTSYAFERGPARVDLVAGVATAAGQRDELLGIESASGSTEDDVLIGNGGPNRLIGLEGRDTLTGGSGDDVLGGGPGRDEVFGGDGADQIAGGGGRDSLDGGAGDDYFGNETSLPDAYACGDGNDRILYPWYPGRGDRFAADCEETIAAAGGVVVTVALRAARRGARHVVVRVHCSGSEACRPSLTLRRGWRGKRRRPAPIASTATPTIAVGRTASVRLRLRGLLQAAGSVRLELGIQAPNGARTGAPLRVEP